MDMENNIELGSMHCEGVVYTTNVWLRAREQICLYKYGHTIYNNMTQYHTI